jgi:tetratricopeptide (TPR) repeat protein
VGTIRDALGRDPSNEWFHRIHAAALVHLERYEEALEAADEAARLAHESYIVHVARADALEGLERHDDAIEALRVALSLAPDSPALMRRLGRAVVRADESEAEQLFRGALAHESNDPWTLHALGVLLRRQGRTEAAMLAFQSAVMLAPDELDYKQSLHETAGGVLGKLSWGALGLVLVVSIAITAAVAMATGAELDGPFLWGMLTVVALMAGMNVYFRFDANRKRAALLETEPQLVKLYDLLEADRREGRL